MKHKRIGLAILALLVLAGLAFAWRFRSEIRQGARYVFNAVRLRDQPAPTTIPLIATAQPISGPPLVSPQYPLALPPGFGVTVFAAGLKDPRMLALGPDGQVYAAERATGRIVRLPDRDSNGLADNVESAAENLQDPSSLAFYRDGSLYVGETTRVLRLNDPDGDGFFQEREIIVDGLPAGGNHHTRTVRFSPDWSILFVSIGSSCNVCDEADERRATIMAFAPDGSNGRIYARGLRNAVGITFRPGTGELWATNNGRDLLGDELPPETVYRVVDGGNYGWPRCHSGRIVDPDLGQAGDCDGVLPPAVEMQAHSAPLGLAFYEGEQFPEEYRGDLFVAFHGSWNRTQPTGYKLVRIPFTNGIPGPAEDFAVGWQAADGKRWGRPVDVLTGADGSLFVSDDGGGFIYRIFYIGR